MTEERHARAAEAVYRTNARTMNSRKEPSGRTRACRPLLTTSTISTQHAASASARDHHKQQGRTRMRCSQGPGAPDGASSGQDGAALARCRLAAGITARAIDLVAAAAITLAPSKVRFGPLDAIGAAAAAADDNGK
jgi:hypothetical protein